MTVECLLPTKKTLKERKGKEMSDLPLFETSMFGPEIPNGSGRFTCVGPTATNRKWFAQVTVRDGIVVKVE